MRKRFIAQGNKWVPIEEYVAPTTERAHLVMGDIKPYQSVIDGSEITSRSRHREHLKAHGCIEIGNEKFPERKREIAPGLKNDLLNAIRRGR